MQITDSAEGATELSHHYITGRVLPDKRRCTTRPASASKHDDSAGPGRHRARHRAPAEKEEAVKNADYERAAELRDKAETMRMKKENIQREWKDNSKEIDGVVDDNIVAEVVSMMTGIPLKRLEKDEAERLLQLEAELHKKVISQHEAISAIARSVRRSRSGLKDPNRPMGSFIFLGPSGVGKTLLAKSLAEFMFGDEEALITIDMSEYMEKHNVSRLIGAPPGYVGSRPQLPSASPPAIRGGAARQIEKAHPDVSTCCCRSWKKAA